MVASNSPDYMNNLLRGINTCIKNNPVQNQIYFGNWQDSVILDDVVLCLELAKDIGSRFSGKRRA